MPHGDIELLPPPGGGNYAGTRLNALRHGVLSQFTVLPWEDKAAYQELLEALVAEHKPQGPTEEHLVEEIAGAIWRKRRLRLGESAAHHLALAKRSDKETAKAALVHVTANTDGASVSDAITATEEQTAADFADLKSGQAMADEALRLLEGKSPITYTRALNALSKDTREWWEEQLTGEADDCDEDEDPYCADPASLKRFLETKVLPWYEERLRELNDRLLIRAQAFGDAVDTFKLKGLARYEVHLDRKLERTLSVLLRLQQLRGTNSSG